jgi:hypothetical protein
MNRAIGRAAKLAAVAFGSIGLLGCSALPSDLDCDSAATRDQIFDLARDQNLLLAFIQENGEGPARPEYPAERSCANDAVCQDLILKNKTVFEEMRNIAPQCEPLQGDQYDGCPIVDERELAKAVEDGSADSPFKSWVKDYFYNSNVQTWPPENDRERFMVGVWRPKLRASYELANQIKEREQTLSNDGEAAERRFWQEMESTFSTLSKQATYDLNSIILTKTSDAGARFCKAELTATVPDWGDASASIRYIVERTSEGQISVTLMGGT